jgi:predicted nucleic acid-binding protein
MSTSHSAYLLDTNVLSEGRRKRPDARVAAFMRSLEGQAVFISVLTLGELRKGIELKRRRDGRGAAHLDVWLNDIEAEYEDRTLAIDRPIADIWGMLAAKRPRPVTDGLLAATAIAHDLSLVTRNVRDFHDVGVPLVNPWE